MSKIIFITLIAVALLCFVKCELEREIYDLEKAEIIFEDYIKKHNKVYKDETEKKMRFELFKKTLKIINDVNSNKELSYTLGLNDFADRTEEEMKKMMAIFSKE